VGVEAHHEVTGDVPRAHDADPISLIVGSGMEHRDEAPQSLPTLAE
jgi:hypothetical protein